MRELGYINDSIQDRDVRLEKIEHAIYDVQFSQMSGKKIFNQNFMRRKFPNLYGENKVVSADKANEALKKLIAQPNK